GLVIVINKDDAVRALRADTGTLVWSHAIAISEWASTLATLGDLTYVSGGDGSIVALRTDDGIVHWKIHLAAHAAPSTLVVAHNILYAKPVLGDNLYALRPNDGKTIWHYQSDDHPCVGGVAVTVVDQVLYCVGGDPSVVLLDASSGQMVQHY